MAYEDTFGIAPPVAPEIQQPWYQRVGSGINTGINGLLGATSQNYGGLLSEQDQQAAQRRAQLAMASQMLQASGYSPQRVSFGQALGSGLQAGQQAQAQSTEDAVRAALIKKQMTPAQRKPVAVVGKDGKPVYVDEQSAIGMSPMSPAGSEPNSVKEYQFAKENGYKGTYQEWTVAGGQTSRPSSVQEWEFFIDLPPEKQQRYLEMKRNPNIFVKDVNTVPTLIRPTVGGGTTTTPLSTPEQEAAAAAEKKRQEASAGAVGTAQGGIQAGIETKGSNAVGTQSTLDLAEPLIDAATGSLVGAGRDKLMAAFGEAPEGAQAIAKLKVLQSNLMMSQPRMEGPQSDADRMSYEQAAGQIGDPSVPAAVKKAAVATIRDIQTRYIQRASQKTGQSSTAKRVKVDAQGNVIK